MKVVPWLLLLVGCAVDAAFEPKTEGVDQPSPVEAEKGPSARPAKSPEPVGMEVPDSVAGQRPEDEPVTMERYPRMVMPGRVAKGLTTQVFVGLATSRGSASKETVVLDGVVSENGGLQLELPPLPVGVDTWSLDVILSAPDFRIVGDDLRTIQLPHKGSSTMARFELALDVVPPGGTASVQAFLFHQGSFMGQIGRTVQAVETLATAQAPVEQTTVASAAALPSPGTHELHLVALDDSRALVMVGAPGTVASHTMVDFDRTALPAFLRPKYGAIRARGLEVSETTDPVGMGMVRGLGAQLWELTPAPLRAHLLDLYANESAQGLRIYTNVPGFPWELLRPQRADGTTLQPLGSRFRLGRWHIRMGMTGRAVPPQEVSYEELVGLIPTYEGAEALPALKRERGALAAVKGFRQVPARSAALVDTMKRPPNGVVHFAGHGKATAQDGASTRYALQLEDGAFDATAFVGIEGKGLRERETVVFFNACELGRADAPATIVEGWAPAVLDAGASGYIGALWPIGDDEAAAFAEAFYAEVENSLASTGRAVITDILRCLRQQGASREDPTWQAYVFYGDPHTALVAEGRGTPDGRWECASR